jgi:hypothetical protein
MFNINLNFDPIKTMFILIGFLLLVYMITRVFFKALFSSYFEEKYNITKILHKEKRDERQRQKKEV